MNPARNRGLILALTGITLLLAATLAAYRPVTPLGPGAPAGEFSAYRANSILQDLTGNGIPHPMGSTADSQVRASIVDFTRKLAYRGAEA